MAETTLILLKPDCVEKGNCGEVLKRLEAQGFKFRGIKMMQLEEALLREHYSHVADRPFFPDLAAFMSKTPVVAVAVEGEDVIKRMRDLLGPTDSTEAPKGTIRGDFGVDKMVNVVHASDSPENAKIEPDRFFPEGIFTY